MSRLKASIALGLAVVLGACAQPTTGPVSYRDADTIIAASTRFDVERFWGKWSVRQAFGDDLALRSVELGPDDRGGLKWVEERKRCEGTVCVLEAATDSVRETGTGMLRVIGADSREYWVLWVDADFRTAAIGTPNGTFGFIIDRRANGAPDRIAAAREVMDFNGYDISQLQVIK